MRKTYKIHLITGSFITFKAEDITVKWSDKGYTEWEAKNSDRFVNFLPQSIVAVEEVK